MPTRQNYSFFLIFFTIQCILNYLSFAGDVMYFSADGNPITKQQYDEESKKSSEKYIDTKKYEILSRQKKTDEIGRLLDIHKDGKLNNFVYKTSNANAVSTSRIYDNNGNLTNDPKFLDSEGRPIYTCTGERRIYKTMISNKNKVNRNDTVRGSRRRGVFIITGPNDPDPTGIMTINNNRTVWKPTSPGQSFITK
jgi:hypothetical protein